MVHAVRVPDRDSIDFVMGEPVAKPGWVVEPGAWLEVPSNTFYGFRGVEHPEPATCRAVDDPLRYKIWMDPEPAEPEEWVDTDLNFGGTFSVSDWPSYAENMPDATWPEAPDNAGVMDEVLRRDGQRQGPGPIRREPPGPVVAGHRPLEAITPTCPS